jgi:hypothetical protein
MWWNMMHSATAYGRIEMFPPTSYTLYFYFLKFKHILIKIEEMFFTIILGQFNHTGKRYTD